MVFRTLKSRLGDRANGAGTEPVTEEFESVEQILEEIRKLDAEIRERPDREKERRVLRLRYLAGVRMINEPAGPEPEYTAADPERLPDGPGLPEFSPSDLTPGLLRAAIQRDGCALVRGLVDPEACANFAEGIERSFVDRLKLQHMTLQGDKHPRVEHYEEFNPWRPPEISEEYWAEFPFQISQRVWVQQGGGVFAIDVPRLMFEMLEMFRAAGLPDLINTYLGETAAVSAQKCTLRKADPETAGAWHQDGRFLPNARAVNVWVALSRCGDEAPGLDIVPKRIDHLLASGDAHPGFEITISDELVAEEAGEAGVIRPIFEPGDAMIFDELFLHQTGSDPSMPNPRYAIESWFFGTREFPEEYVPFAV